MPRIKQEKKLPNWVPDVSTTHAYQDSPNPSYVCTHAPCPRHIMSYPINIIAYIPGVIIIARDSVSDTMNTAAMVVGDDHMDTFMMSRIACVLVRWYLSYVI